MSSKIVDLTQRQMASNITISGILPFEDFDENGVSTEDYTGKSYDDLYKMENCEQKVKNFLTKMLGLEVKDEHIYLAHRSGQDNTNRGKIITARCHPKIVNLATAKSSKLKEKTNTNGQSYYLNRQLPEAVLAEKKEISHAIGKIKKTNQGKTFNQRTKYQVKDKQLFVDDAPVQKQLVLPTVEEMFPQNAEQQKIDKVKFWFSDSKEEKGSIFTAVATKISSIAEAKRAYRKACQLYPSATHIVAAYDVQKKQGNFDDQEHGAGLRIQKYLEAQNVTNKIIFLVRSYGGQKLGFRWFEIMEDAVKQVLLKMK